MKKKESIKTKIKLFVADELSYRYDKLVEKSYPLYC